MNCEICGCTAVQVIDLGRHPLCDDLQPVSAPKACREFPIRIHYCNNCKTALNEFQVEKPILFPEDYHYRSRFTADVLEGMEDLLRMVDKILHIQGKNILDVGCNDGSLLDIARSQFGGNTFGIEPTGAATEAASKGHRIIKDFLTVASAEDFVSEHGHPNIITFTNVFAHISNFSELLASVNVLAGKDSALVIENHYLGSVVSKCQFDTFYHEHPRTYSITSFTQIAQLLNMEIVHASFPKRYGGNVRVVLSRSLGRSSDLDSLLEKDKACDGIEHMQSKINFWKQSKGTRIQDLAERHGPLPAKAFPGRSAIPFKLIQADQSLISGCFERNSSLKVGHFVPGSNIPILPEREIIHYISNEKTPIINSAWHISREIHAYIRNSLGLPNPIIDLIEPDDFG
jgi:hypothetical protein